MPYKYYQDPGHGWIAVKRSELARLKIQNDISSYSYERGKTVYLEEDSDAAKFIDAKRALGETVEFDQRHTDKTHPIRSYDCYRSI